MRLKAPIMTGSEETAGCIRSCGVAVGAGVVPGGTTVATSAWFNGTGLLAMTGVDVSRAITGVAVGTMGVAVFTTGMGLGRPVVGVAMAARGVGWQRCVSVWLPRRLLASCHSSPGAKR